MDFYQEDLRTNFVCLKELLVEKLGFMILALQGKLQFRNKRLGEIFAFGMDST